MQKKPSHKTSRLKKKTPAYKNIIREKAKKIKMLILDVDGVMTDGGIILDNEGNEFKVFNVRDGHGIKLLLRNDIKVAIITGRESGVVLRRAKELGIQDVYQKYFNKVTAYDEIKNKFSLTDEEIAYMGDDVVDIPVMKRAGLAATVSDAQEDTIQFADIVTKAQSGKGAVRELTEFILDAKGYWEGILNGYMEA